MKKDTCEQLLERQGLKKTRLRMALVRHFVDIGHAQSYNDLQAALIKDVDKSTLYRNLASFERAGIIHRIDDHSGVAKYAFGESPTEGNEHAHFVCDCCETVYCMERQVSLQVNVPKGFKTKKVQTIIRGTCANC